MWRMGGTRQIYLRTLFIVRGILCWLKSENSFLFFEFLGNNDYIIVVTFSGHSILITVSVRHVLLKYKSLIYGTFKIKVHHLLPVPKGAVA